MTDLGGHAQFFGEHHPALAARPSRHGARRWKLAVDILMARVNRTQRGQLAANSAAPVINGMSDYNHPTQERSATS